MIWVPQQTRDGSFTFFSETFGEAFHSDQGAKSEAFTKFAQVTDLVVLALTGRVRLLDVCYGLGYNSAAALETIWQVNPDCQVELYALELDRTVPIAATSAELLAFWTPQVRDVLIALANDLQMDWRGLKARLLIGDARQTVDSVRASGFRADAIFFDPFSPRKCPQLWTVEFLNCVVGCLAPLGKLATYSRSAAVRSALLEVGLRIGSIPTSAESMAGQWSMGTVAALDGGLLRSPLPELSEMELDHLMTRAGIPFRDPGLVGSQAEILARHELEQAGSGRRSTSSWRRQWGV